MSSISAVGIGRTNQNDVQLSLHSKSQFLREKIKLARQAGRMPPEVFQRIESHLSAISQENNPVGQWNTYELAYESYIPLALPDDLLSVFLLLRARAHRLDEHSQEIWSREKLSQIEDNIRSGQVSSTLRSEVTTLARAIHECGIRRKQDTEAKSKLVRTALCVSAFLCVLAVSLLTVLEFRHIAVPNPWLLVATGLLGAIGALVSVIAQLRGQRLEGHDLREDKANLFLRGAFGATAAVTIALFLQLRVIVFPFLHGSRTENGSLSAAALYLFGFLSGLAVQPLFGAFEKKRTKSLASRKADEVGAPQSSR